jgi:DMSO/TMAO reductase YedYZ molybdopterin-dependent catalytic subunit
MRNDQLKDEATYDVARADRFLWERSRATGLSRRDVLKLAATGAGAAALGLIPAPQPACANHPGSIVKPTPADQFNILGTNAEMRWEVMASHGYTVPNANFFVRNHTRTPHIDAGTWRLRIEGSGVDSPVELTYDDIVAMGSVSETKFIECAGNGRSFFSTQQGTPAPGSQWKLGAVGVAEWTGVPLSVVLDRAGLRSTAVDVMPEGLDPVVTPAQGHVRRPMPIEKALDESTLLVYAMNGEPLPEDHGFPVRALVPGSVGIANIKWVGRIEVSETPLFSTWNTTQYRLFGPDYPDTPLLTEQQVKSAFELPWQAQVVAGRYLLNGRSWSGHHRIERVDVSVDGGTTWQRATLDSHNPARAWVRWSVVWDARPGPQILMARATDKRGNTQPFTVPFNTLGYQFWAVVQHPVTVVAA